MITKKKCKFLLSTRTVQWSQKSLYPNPYPATLYPINLLHQNPSSPPVIFSVLIPSSSNKPPLRHVPNQRHDAIEPQAAPRIMTDRGVEDSQASPDLCDYVIPRLRSWVQAGTLGRGACGGDSWGACGLGVRDGLDGLEDGWDGSWIICKISSGLSVWRFGI